MPFFGYPKVLCCHYILWYIYSIEASGPCTITIGCTTYMYKQNWQKFIKMCKKLKSAIKIMMNFKHINPDNSHLTISCADVSYGSPMPLLAIHINNPESSFATDSITSTDLPADSSNTVIVADMLYPDRDHSICVAFSGLASTTHSSRASVSLSAKTFCDTFVISAGSNNNNI